MVKECRIKYFPISFFSMILGMAGFTIAFEKIEKILDLSIDISNGILYLTVFLLAMISIIYLIKMIRYFSEVKKEFNDPIKISFFPTFSISLLLLSIAFVSKNLLISKYLWWTGMLLHILLTIKIISIWIHHDKFDIKHMNPAWFIPAVGNILVPVVGVKFFNQELSWLFFSIGIMFWIILLVIFFNRIIFHHPLPEKLLPTLFILIAPPAVGFIAFVKLTGEISEFSKILYYFAMFLTILLFSQMRLFYKIKFYLSWWAYSFPIAAMTIASVLMFDKSRYLFFRYVALILFTLLVTLIVVLLVRTIYAAYKREICIEED